MSKSLFLLKIREDYSSDPSYSGSYQIATGMYNSAKFVADVIDASPLHEAQVALVQDGNSIDAAVFGYNPDFVFLEGLWVTPAKVQELMGLAHHAGRRWVIRIHSEIPFLATEGVAMDWISQYLLMGATVAPNAPRAHQQLVHLAKQLGLTDAQVEVQVPLLPNCYPTDFAPLAGLDTSAKTHLDVACFGAFRPFKNHLQQVFIADRFAQKLGLPLRFHTNSRFDFGGGGNAKNVNDALINLGAEHVAHVWEDRDTFLQSMAAIDVLLQDSMTETFNIVAADCVWVGRPMLVSNEISWAYPVYGDPQNVDKSLKALEFIWANKPFFIQKNRSRLKAFAKQAANTWLAFV